MHNIAAKRDVANTMARVKDPSAKMPKLYPAPLTEDDLKKVAEYVHDFK